MKRFIYPFGFILLLSILFLNLHSGCSHDMKVLLVTGGHSFDTTEFFNLFWSYDSMSVDTISQPFANKKLEEIKEHTYDVIVFYDMWQKITENQKESFNELLESGTGIVFLHHSIVSYQQWDAFKNFIGGRYWEVGYQSDTSKRSGYEHDLDLDVKIIDRNQPVTKDLIDFQIHDEGYSNIEIIPSVHPLLSTNHPSCSKYIAWTNEYKQSRIVYIMLGHDQQAYTNTSFRKLVNNAINWVASD